MSNKKTFETRIRRVDNSSKYIQKQVSDKLTRKESNFKYKGYAAIHYTNTARGLRLQRAEPIEGNMNDYFDMVLQPLHDSDVF